MIIEILTNAATADSGIAGIFGDNIWAGALPDEPDYPALVFSKASNFQSMDLEGPDGMQRARVQADVYWYGYADTSDSGRAVKRFMTMRPPPGPPCVIDMARCINEFDMPVSGHVEATERAGPRLCRRVLEFTVWYRED